MSNRKKLIKNPQEALSAPINPSGEGEDPAVRALLHNMSGATNTEALDIAMALQQIIRGQNSLLENQDRMAQEITALKAKMADVDRITEKFEANQQSFIQEVFDRSEKLKAVGNEKDKIQAQGAQMFTEAVSKARAEMVNDRLKFEQELSHMDMETVLSPGVPTMVQVGGHQEIRILPEEVRIKHKVWRFAPGMPTKVPSVVAEVLRLRRISQAETAERQAALQKNLEQPQLEAAMAAIDAKYHTNGGRILDAV